MSKQVTPQIAQSLSSFSRALLSRKSDDTFGQQLLTPLILASCVIVRHAEGSFSQDSLIHNSRGL
jgi:hypothetical protein